MLLCCCAEAPQEWDGLRKGSESMKVLRGRGRYENEDDDVEGGVAGSAGDEERVNIDAVALHRAEGPVPGVVKRLTGRCMVRTIHGGISARQVYHWKTMVRSMATV